VRGLKDKVALVTGAGRRRGIGRAIALRLAEEGCDVVVCGLPRDPATFPDHERAARWQGVASVADEIRALGRRSLGVDCDVVERSEVEAMVAMAVGRLGRIDILVNNAALFSALEPRPFERIDAAEWRKVMEINTLGVFLCCRACVPHMRKAGGGRIINLASGAPLKGVPLLLHYVSSKGAVIAFTRALAREVGKDGITVNVLVPGFTLSEGVLKSAGHVKHGEASRASRAITRDEQPEDLVGAVSFLASADAAFMTGQTLVVDGGSAMV
jgi:NAD(P)-dependent dehydrogenase (short-subunit alcohol dehydrogenase family)